MTRPICGAALAMAAAVLIGAFSAAAQEKPPAADYIKVEIRGDLETNIVALGGESTGTVIHADNVTWELDLGGNAMLQEAAKKLHQKPALVTGLYRKIKGVEKPERHIVKVETLKAAEK